MANVDAPHGFKLVRRVGGGAGVPLEKGTTRSNATISAGAAIVRSNGLIHQADNADTAILGVAAEGVTGVTGVRDEIHYYPALPDLIFSGQCSGNGTIGYVGKKVGIEGTGATMEVDENGTTSVAQIIGLKDGSAYGTNAEFLFIWCKSQFSGVAS
jgi:hypothetical protein